MIIHFLRSGAVHYIYFSFFSRHGIVYMAGMQYKFAKLYANDVITTFLTL